MNNFNEEANVVVKLTEKQAYWLAYAIRKNWVEITTGEAQNPNAKAVLSQVDHIENPYK